jgi:hypothetical protein
MSKICRTEKAGPMPSTGLPSSKPRAVTNRPVPILECGLPAMTQYKGQFVCWGCREELEARDAKQQNTPRR